MNFLKRFYLQIILFFLVLIYILSAPRASHSFDTALVNPKYDITKITLSYSKEGTLLLKKTGSFWTGEFHGLDSKVICFPCDSSMVEKFIENSRKLVKATEVSESLSNMERFGLSENDSFLIEFYSDLPQSVSQIRFGSLDSVSSIYFTAKNLRKIFSTPSPVKEYLSTSPNFWCSPEIFPSEIAGKISPDKGETGLLKLRHGSVKLIPSRDLDWSGARQVSIDGGDGSTYTAEFIPSGNAEGDYLCRFFSSPSAQRSPEEKEAILRFNYVSGVSSWTVNRIFEK